MNADLARLRDILSAGKRMVFFGGAGVSTESGIPDFRSEKGLYSARKVYGHSPETLLSHSFFMGSPQIFFRYYKENLIHPAAAPNAAHKALAKLEQQGRMSAIVTQNIDGLHQAAGSRVVYELHGATARNYCMDCLEKYDQSYILAPGNCGADGIIPRCAKCGGIVRPDVVLYEEGLSHTVMTAAVRAIEAADVLIVGGTSLAVYPAAGLIQYFKGDTLVLINLSETPYDSRADLVVRRPIGEALSAL